MIKSKNMPHSNVISSCDIRRAFWQVKPCITCHNMLNLKGVSLNIDANYMYTHT